MVVPTTITQDVVVSSYPWHSSTYEEGAQRGYADVIRSWGMANLQNSQAVQGFEHARREYLDNRMKATQVYFEMRRYNEDARRAERGSPLSMEQYVRLARQMAPEPLGPSQLDPLTGAIGWPGPLRQAEYQTLRQRIERLFQDRAAGYADFAAIRVAIEDFYDHLRADIMKYQPDDYLVARKFLDSLAYMARATSG
jgi:hypothetical protein